MSFLYPLLFVAGLAAVALPIVLHMIRRHTSRRIPFSTLMFLRPTAPRLKNRRRLEHLPLLILRCLILCLLALAFARPFIPRSVTQGPIQVGKRRVILIDTSASMRRADLWEQAQREARTALDDLESADRACVLSFDRDTQTLIGFESWASMEPTQRTAIAIEQIDALSPGWNQTALGKALVAAAEAMEDDEVNEQQRSGRQREIVLISDFQQGSDITALQAYEWPEDTQLIVKLLAPRATTNAALQLMTDRGRLAPADANEPVRVRVTNSADATDERFQLGWAERETTVDVYVPPGRSIVVSAPAQMASSVSQRLVLTGDEHDFDNTLYVAPSVRRPIDILYLGNDEPNDPKAMLFYVQQAFDVDGPLAAQISYRHSDAALNPADVESAHLIVVTDAVHEQNLAALRHYLESGRTILLVMKSSATVATLAGLTGIETLTATEADVDRYAMLARIAFDHPLLASFADPRFGDFTRIHIWKYRQVDPAAIPSARVLAWFDSSDPAWCEVPLGKGALLVWTSGWQPADSDLALSSKFAPLLYSALEYGGTLADRQAQYVVGNAVPVSVRMISEPADRQIRKPDGSTVALGAGSETFDQTDLPGIYTTQVGGEEQQFAINLAAEESRTDPMPIEDIEKLGVSVGSTVNAALVRTEQASVQSSLSEMESEQKLWRWGIAAALVLLLGEIWLGGRPTRTAPRPEGGQP